MGPRLDLFAYVLQGWAKEHGVQGSSGELCGKPEVKQALLQEVSSTGKKLGLKVRLGVQAGGCKRAPEPVGSKQG